LATARELESLEPESAISFAQLFDQLKIGLNKQREIITFIKEIAARDGLSARDIIESSRVREIISDKNIDRGQIIYKLRSHLRQCRYPRLAEAEKTFEMHRRNLKLGENMKLMPPKEFEATTYGLNLTFSDLAELKDLQKKISNLIQNPALKKILDR
jgi:ParB family chromosome partitioning protein